MIYLAGGTDAAGASQAAITADGVTATREWTKTKNGSEFSVVAAYGTWGSGTVIIEHQIVSGVTGATGQWITIASLTSGSTTSGLLKVLPNGNYRATLSGATTPSLTIVMKPI